MVSFILYLLMVVLLDLGRASLATQTIQSAADVFATELARAPVGATKTFQEALDDIDDPSEYVTKTIYDEGYLVIVLDESADTQGELDGLFASLPIVNQILRPLMIRETLPDGSGTEVLRYPGAILEKADTPYGYTVMIPRVQYPAPGLGLGETILEWLPVIQEVLPDANAPSNFPINSTGPFPGYVNVRINYPYQAAAISAFREGALVSGDDGAVSDTASLPDGVTFPAWNWQDDGAASPYAGQYGLGYHYALVQQVRPYRKVLSIQAAARREGIFKP
jgi:hypothetical protein